MAQMQKNGEACPFCDVRADLVWAENDKAVALYGGYPLAESHTLVVPRGDYAGPGMPLLRLSPVPGNLGAPRMGWKAHPPA